MRTKNEILLPIASVRLDSVSLGRAGWVGLSWASGQWSMVNGHGNNHGHSHNHSHKAVDLGPPPAPIPIPLGKESRLYTLTSILNRI